MRKYVIASLLSGSMLLAVPAVAQDAAIAPAPATAETMPMEEAPAEPAATAPLPAAPGVEAQNAAITAYGKARELQSAGDNAGALLAFNEALPTVRQMVAANPTDVQTAGFLGTILSQSANSELQLKNNDAAYAFLEEAVPQWRVVYNSNTGVGDVRATLLNHLVDLGNLQLIKGDKPAAQVYFEESLSISKSASATVPDDKALHNLLFASLIGMNQSTGEASFLEEAKLVAADLKAKNAVSAANEPIVAAILG